MTDTSRREAIKTIAKGAIYASPIITTLIAPARAQAQLSGMGTMGGGMGMSGMLILPTPTDPTGLAEPPWAKKPGD